jgi:hypothetical protein
LVTLPFGHSGRMLTLFVWLKWQDVFEFGVTQMAPETLSKISSQSAIPDAFMKRFD